MSITLTTTDLERLSRAVELLVSPFAQPDVETWRSAVTRELKALLHADTAGFHLPVDEGPEFYTDDFTQAQLEAYDEVAPPPLPDGTDMVTRGAQLGVSTLERAYGPHVERFRRSAYYNAYAAELGKHDVMFTICRLSGPTPDAMASLQFFHGRRTGPRFGERELGLLRVLFPALRAGAEACLQWGRHRRDLLNALDGLDAAAWVVDAEGRLLHETPALGALLHAEPEPERQRLLAALHELGDAVRPLGRPGDAPTDAPHRGFEREVCTHAARYRLRGCLYGGPPAGAAGTVVIGVERLTPRLAPESELRAAYGLTAAEVRVAALLAQGRSNAEIATALFISPHTARRHTERIMRKLEVGARAQVAGMLLQ